MPNTGLGLHATRQDAIRFRAIFDTNPVTRSVCREIWREWLVADSVAIPDECHHLRRDLDALGRQVEYLRTQSASEAVRAVSGEGR